MDVCGCDITVSGRFIRVATLSAEMFEFIEDPEAAVELLRKSPKRIDLFSFVQCLADPSPQYTYPMEWDNLAVIPVSTFDHWWKSQIGTFPRNRARQAEKKGVKILEVPYSEDLVRGIWEIYNECEIRQGKRFPHYGKDLETVRKMTATFLDRSAFLGAYLGERLIGFAKLHCDKARTQAGLTHILSLVEHRDKAPTNALVARAVRYCADNKIPHLHYLRFTYGNKWDSLTDFKERNGFKQVNIPRYYVPLTRTGRIAFQLGLHKRLVDHIPDSIAARLRALRKFWYTQKAQPPPDQASTIAHG
jgi:hypothetical protein